MSENIQIKQTTSKDGLSCKKRSKYKDKIRDCVDYSDYFALIWLVLTLTPFSL